MFISCSVNNEVLLQSIVERNAVVNDCWIFSCFCFAHCPRFYSLNIISVPFREITVQALTIWHFPKLNGRAREMFHAHQQTGTSLRFSFCYFGVCLLDLFDSIFFLFVYLMRGLQKPTGVLYQSVGNK